MDAKKLLDPKDVAGQWKEFFGLLGVACDQPPAGADLTARVGRRGTHILISLQYPFSPDKVKLATEVCEATGTDTVIVYGAPKVPQFEILREEVVMGGAIMWLFRPAGHLNFPLPPDLDKAALPSVFQQPVAQAIQEDHAGILSVQPLYSGKPLPLRNKKPFVTEVVAAGCDGKLAGFKYRGLGRSPQGPRLRRAYAGVAASVGQVDSVRHIPLSQLVRETSDGEVTVEACGGDGHVHGPHCRH